VRRSGGAIPTPPACHRRRELARRGVTGEVARVVDHRVRFGVSSAEGGGGVTYWVGEALGGVDSQDDSPEPERTTSMTRTAAANTAHLARVLKESGYRAV
jgi:hypothetical protein